MTMLAMALPLAAQFRGDEPYPKVHDPSTVMVEGGDK